MKIIETELKGCKIIEPKIYKDERGLFLETFQVQRYKVEADIDNVFLQDNFSTSVEGVLRGLHYQKTKPQGKLVRVTRGKVFDVAVDIRRHSSTYGKWNGLELSDENKLQLWIPPGFAHGFLVLSKEADFEYKCTQYYDPNDEGAILWNDRDLRIDWPKLNNIIISDKDAKGIGFRDLNL